MQICIVNILHVKISFNVVYIIAATSVGTAAGTTGPTGAGGNKYEFRFV